MKNFLRRFWQEEDGAELVEWAIVIAIVAVIAVPVMALMKTAQTKINDANTLINSINPGDVVTNPDASGTGTVTGTGTGVGGTPE